MTLSTLDACSITNGTSQYLENVEVEVDGDCSEFNATATGTLREEGMTYKATCGYSTNTYDISCTAPRKSS
uniref:Uncharacterized protein n=1 Tax=Thermodesulfobacterium geofontis TaxID=1295609 RepID=A0A7V5XI28_9BACT